VYAFQNQKGDLAFTLFNWTDTDQPIEFLIHPDRYGMAYDATSNTLADTWRVTAHNGTDSVVLANDLNQAQDQAWLAPKFENFQPNQPWILLYEKQ
jgi:hypothetical protein